MSKSSGPILLAYDGSETSATAIAVAGRLLPRRQALVCHVWSGLTHDLMFGLLARLPDAVGDAAAELDAEDMREADKLAADGVRLAREAGFEAQPLLARNERPTWHVLSEAADCQEASVIVVGAHGLSGVRRAVLGSVSTALVHHAHAPVLVVPPPSPSEESDGPLLLCYDGSDNAKRAIAIAGRLFAPRSGLVLHFSDSWVAEAPALAGLGRAVEGMAVELDEIADEQSSHIADDGVELAEQSGFEATPVSERATAPGWIMVRDIADEHACAAIVVGTRGLTGISAALGNVSNGVVHNSRRPVLVVPPDNHQ